MLPSSDVTSEITAQLTVCSETLPSSRCTFHGDLETQQTGHFTGVPQLSLFPRGVSLADGAAEGPRIASSSKGANHGACVQSFHNTLCAFRYLDRNNKPVQPLSFLKVPLFLQQ